MWDHQDASYCLNVWPIAKLTFTAPLNFYLPDSSFIFLTSNWIFLFDWLNFNNSASILITLVARWIVGVISGRRCEPLRGKPVFQKSEWFWRAAGISVARRVSDKIFLVRQARLTRNVSVNRLFFCNWLEILPFFVLERIS